MRIDILTLFPEMFTALRSSVIKKASDNNLIEINIINIRDYSKDLHKKCDDYPFGGGAGMVMSAQPIYDAISSVKNDNSHIIFTSPKGRVWNQRIAEEFSKKDHLIIVCGHYEGIDQRVIDLCANDEISIGDYVLTGGELPAMVIADSIARLINGVISEDSLSEESFSKSLLEYPQYTRPQNFMGLEVPEVLISGNHKKIEEFRYNKSVEITKKLRPDLLKK